MINKLKAKSLMYNEQPEVASRLEFLQDEIDCQDFRIKELEAKLVGQTEVILIHELDANVKNKRIAELELMMGRIATHGTVMVKMIEHKLEADK
jgi:ABC-type branched-subunit amino acid transport system ATPase component